MKSKSFRQGVKQYLEYHQRLGFKTRSDRCILANFVTFMNYHKARHITTELALSFATLNPRASKDWWAIRYAAVRRFAIYWSQKDPDTEIPPKNLLPYSYIRRTPYIYTDKEIRELLKCQESGSRLDQYTYFILFGLLAVTGMRIGEALALNCDAVDIDNKIITIHQGKFGKSRYIPIHKSTAEVLRNYSNYRNHCHSNPITSRFFISGKGESLNASNVRRIFRNRLRKIGILKPNDRFSPTIMGLRHTFAVKTLLRWYKKGVTKIDQYIPLLSTYLGHVKPTKTYWYLTATPQLLRLVLSRLEKIKKGGNL